MKKYYAMAAVLLMSASGAFAAEPSVVVKAVAGCCAALGCCGLGLPCCG